MTATKLAKAFDRHLSSLGRKLRKAIKELNRNIEKLPATLSVVEELAAIEQASAYAVLLCHQIKVTPAHSIAAQNTRAAAGAWHRG